MTVTHLGVIAKASGANVLLGLYRNSGGVPTTLVVGTPPTALVAGRLEMPVTNTRITAGTYWLMAMYAFRDFSEGLPATVSGASSMFGQRYNYFLRGIP